MKIAIDVFGGDNAPYAMLQGAYDAKKESNGVGIILCGDKEKIKSAALELKINIDDMEIVHAPLVMPVDEEPENILKDYKESSMAKALELVSSNQAQAIISAGSTGALVFGTTFIVKRIKGIKRVAICTVIPTQKGCYLLVDVGANAECRPEMLVQFAIMGSTYMENVLKIKKPKVGLVNNGSEETKGTQLYVETHSLLKKAPLNFVGNIEPRYIPQGECDVVVCDGFTGNVILKLTEGMAKFFANSLKDIFETSFVSKLAAAMVIGQIKEFKHKMDYKEYGGALLIGATSPVIKAHGSSDAKAFKNAVLQGIKTVETDVVGKIKNGLEK